MGLLMSARAAVLAAEAQSGLRLELRPGPMYLPPLYLDFFFEDARPRDHEEYVVGGVKVWVPLALTWVVDHEVVIEAAADGHLHGLVHEAQAPF